MKNHLAIQFGKIEGLGPLGLQGQDGAAAPGRFNLFISGAIGLITAIAMIWFTFNFLIGALGIIMSEGDKNKLESAKNRITTGMIGLIVTIAGIFIIQAFGSLIGIGNFILSPTQIIDIIAPK